MKYFFIFFGIFFIIFFFIGFTNGTSEVSSPYSLANYIFSNVSVIPVKNSCILAYVADKESLYTFDIDHSTFLKCDYDDKRKSFKDSSSNKAVLKYFNATVYSVLGAGGLGIAGKDFFVEGRPLYKEIGTVKGSGTAIGILAGLFSGYYVGHWVGIKTGLPAKYSPQFVSIIANDSTWKKRKEFIFTQIVNKLLDETANLSNSSFKVKIQNIIENAYGAVEASLQNNKSYQISSHEFLLLYKAQRVIDLHSSREFSKLDLTDIISIVIVAGVVLSIVGGLTMILYKPFSQKRRTRKLTQLGAPSDLVDAVEKIAKIMSANVSRDLSKLSESEFLLKHCGPTTDFEIYNYLKVWNLGFIFPYSEPKSKLGECLTTMGVKDQNEANRIIVTTLYRHIHDLPIELDTQLSELVTKR